MKKQIALFTVIALVLSLLAGCGQTSSAPAASEKPEDKPVKHGKGLSSGDYALFYTQTTFLALLAGYLIIFKVKGTKTKEKMHGRKLDRK